MKGKDIENIFTQIANGNVWQALETKSGPGSTHEQTKVIRKLLPDFLCKHGIKTVLDIPCGDFHWMQLIHSELSKNLEGYLGVEIVRDLVDANNVKYADEKFRFLQLDITISDLPTVDVIFSRDVLVHFSYRDILKALKQIKKSGSRYLLTTSFTNPVRRNCDIVTGYWRPINLLKYPFFFPAPIDLIIEECTENNGEYLDKSLLLFDVKKINFTILRLHLFLKRITGKL